MDDRYVLTDDGDLVTLLQTGDETAFAEIYRRYARPLADFAGAKLLSLEDARDIIHDLFVALWEGRKSLAVTSNLSAYLFASARYKIIDRIRKNVTREEYARAVLALSANDVASTDQALAARELQQTLANSISRLSPAVREVYVLSREENLNTREIAVMLNRSEQTVKNQLSTALKHLRQSLPGLSVMALLLWCNR